MSVVFSEIALNKIKREQNVFNFVRQSESDFKLYIPMFAYYRRSFQQMLDGTEKELGAGLILSFRASEELGEHFIIDAAPGLSVAVRPLSHFKQGHHRIVVENERFVLYSDAD